MVQSRCLGSFSLDIYIEFCVDFANVIKRNVAGELDTVHSTFFVPPSIAREKLDIATELVLSDRLEGALATTVSTIDNLNGSAERYIMKHTYTHSTNTRFLQTSPLRSKIHSAP